MCSHLEMKAVLSTVRASLTLSLGDTVLLPFIQFMGLHLWMNRILLHLQVKGNFGTEVMLTGFIRLQRGTKEEQVCFPVLLSTGSVLRNKRNFQIKPERSNWMPSW